MRGWAWGVALAALLGAGACSSGGGKSADAASDAVTEAEAVADTATEAVAELAAEPVPETLPDAEPESAAETVADVVAETLQATWSDPATTLEWQDPPKKTTDFWQPALDYCEGLAWAGHDDWRLPSISELRTLVRGCEGTLSGGACGVTDQCLEDNCKSDACECSGHASGDGPGLAGCYWAEGLTGKCLAAWSASTEPSGGRAWYVYFPTGRVRSDDLGGGIYHAVRCVRTEE
jgi:hypothetical protein